MFPCSTPESKVESKVAPTDKTFSTVTAISHADDTINLADMVTIPITFSKYITPRNVSTSTLKNC